MSIDHYSTTEICQALSIKYGRFREWVDRGYVVPAQRAEGSGDRTFFSKHGVYLVALFKHLIEVEGFDRQVAGENVQGVKKYLDAARTWEETGESAFLIFSRKPWNPDGGTSKSVRALLSEHGRSSQPTVQIVSENMLREQSMFDVLSHKGFYQLWNDFESLTIVNFKKIRGMVDSKLG
jgi:hypothetical protein